MLVKVTGTDTETVVNALIKNARKLPQELYKSLTWDRGSEMAGHKHFTVATDIKVYFCDPQNPWQRGTNEITNGLLRQYLPKGIDISTYSRLTTPSIVSTAFIADAMPASLRQSRLLHRAPRTRLGLVLATAAMRGAKTSAASAAEQFPRVMAVVSASPAAINAMLASTSDSSDRFE